MKRRWLAIALVAFANVIALLTYLLAPGIAEAALTGCQFTDPNTITCTDTGSGDVIRTFTHSSGSNFTASAGFCDIRTQTNPNNLTLALGTKQSNGSYAANITSSCNGTSAVTIANPKNITPATGGATGGTSPSPSPANNNTDPTNLCDAGTLTWLNCAIMNAAISVIDAIRDNIIAPFLHVQPLTTTVKSNDGKSIANPAYTIWQNFRNIAAIFLILIFFAIIFGTALGFDNYTIKKTMPHLVAGAILMPLSWYICAVMIDIGNVLGQGLTTLMDAIIPKPLVDFTQPLSTIFYAGTGVLAYLALKGAMSDISMAILITIIIAVLATFFTLVLRQILITLFVVLSPFAVMAWILPNTEKWFTQWWQNLLKLILMYPLIMLLFEAGRIFALTAGASFTGGSGASDLQKAAVPILALVGLYLPLGAVPWTFKWAGGAMKAGSGAIGRIGGAADKRWGKGSPSDKERHERFMNKRASVAADPTATGILGRANRRLAQLQSGTGGFTSRQTMAQKAKMWEMQSKHRAFTGNIQGRTNAEKDMLNRAQALKGSTNPIEQQEREQILDALSSDAGVRMATEAARSRHIGEVAEQRAHLQSEHMLHQADAAQMMQAQTDIATTKEIEHRIAQASQQYVDVGGQRVKIADAHNVSGADKVLYDTAKSAAAAGDYSTMMASMQTLGKWGGGQQRLDQLRRDPALFGGTDDKKVTIDPSVMDGNALNYWDTATSKVEGAPDLTRVPDVGFANPSDRDIQSWKHRTIDRFMQYSTKDPAKLIYARKVITESLANTRLNWDGDQLQRVADAVNDLGGKYGPAYGADAALKTALNTRLAARGMPTV